MSRFLKVVVIVEAVIILSLLIMTIYFYHQTTTFKKTKYPQGLLSQRVYTEVLEPQSLLITNFAPFEKELPKFPAF